MNSTILLIVTANLLLVLAIIWGVQAIARQKKSRQLEQAITVLIDNIRGRGKDREQQLRDWLSRRMQLPEAQLTETSNGIREQEKVLYKSVISALRSGDAKVVARLHHNVESLMDRFYQLPDAPRHTPAGEPKSESAPAMAVAAAATAEANMGEPPTASPALDTDTEVLSDLQHTAIDEMFSELDETQSNLQENTGAQEEQAEEILADTGSSDTPQAADPCPQEDSAPATASVGQAADDDHGAKLAGTVDDNGDEFGFELEADEQITDLDEPAEPADSPENPTPVDDKKNGSVELF